MITAAQFFTVLSFAVAGVVLIVFFYLYLGHSKDLPADKDLPARFYPRPPKGASLEEVREWYSIQEQLKREDGE